MYSKRYYFHLLYIYIFDDFTRNSVCDLILLHAQKFNRACNKSVEDQGRRTRMGSVGNWSRLLKMAKVWQKMKKNLVQLKPISILVPETQFWGSVLSLLLPPLSMNLRSSRDQESCFITSMQALLQKLHTYYHHNTPCTWWQKGSTFFMNEWTSSALLKMYNLFRLKSFLKGQNELTLFSWNEFL